MSEKHKLQEKIFHCGETYFQSLLEDINKAKKSIDIEVYIFSKDNLGKKILKELIAATKRKKIRIRLLVDGAGTPFWGGKLIRKLEKYGIKTKVFNPLPWEIWQWRRSSSKMPFLLHIFYMILKINSRNHRKSIIIDDKIAYVGSLNIDQRHLSKKNGGQNWRDTAVRLKGCDLKNISVAFNKAWDHNIWQTKIDKLVNNINNKIRLNNTAKTRIMLYRNLLKTLGKAKNRVWITNAYFIPNNLFLKKIKKLARAGVDVRIIVPKKSDIPSMQWAASSLYEKLLNSGVKIYEYSPSMLHAKTIIIDDWVVLGSSNLNHRSLLHDLEIDIKIESEQAKEDVISQFKQDQANSETTELSSIPKRKVHKKIIGNIIVFLKYWV
ncbi:MAG: phosphatidylserine/phosphatidylglycerophosphate/cardiolipin synthase family protein [Legionellales bacterium]|jgi:cardiolipin synthase A/B|nr:phosphatidylserine/phosphatidylglycerophosphate/cardiolipin synthase family protein [Legionellales bacterium]